MKFIKRESGLKTFENKGFFTGAYIYFQLKDEEGPEGLAFQVVISLKQNKKLNKQIFKNG